jgi:hypothetical protein
LSINVALSGGIHRGGAEAAEIKPLGRRLCVQIQKSKDHRAKPLPCGFISAASAPPKKQNASFVKNMVFSFQQSVVSNQLTLG